MLRRWAASGVITMVLFGTSFWWHSCSAAAVTAHPVPRVSAPGMGDGGADAHGIRLRSCAAASATTCCAVASAVAASSHLLRVAHLLALLSVVLCGVHVFAMYRVGAGPVQGQHWAAAPLQQVPRACSDDE